MLRGKGEGILVGVSMILRREWRWGLCKAVKCIGMTTNIRYDGAVCKMT